MAILERRLLVPEVVQSSSMDCGPAALKSFLEGHGIRVSYGRLREACQTDVDGTSIETLEELANGLGAPVEQVLLPRDAVLLEESRSLPALAVFRLPNGNTHFVVVWSLVAGLAQVMDPASGRKWLTRERLLTELHEHSMTVPASEWRAWAASDEGLAILRRRFSSIGVRPDVAERLVQDAVADEGFSALAALDATLRVARSLVDAGGAKKGSETSSIVQSLFERARRNPGVIPDGMWSVRAANEEAGSLVARGAVLLRPAARPDEASSAELPVAVALARAEPRPKPAGELFRWVAMDGMGIPVLLAGAVLAFSAAIVVEAILFRGFLQFPGLGAPLVVLLLMVVALDFVTFQGVLGLGRRLETRLRLAFQTKVARLSDRYFASRLTSDMAERQHSVHLLRKFPRLAGQILRESGELLLTAGAIVWLAPQAAPIVAVAVVAAFLIPLAGGPVLQERDARVRSHLGGLSRFYLDALLGLVPLRVHGAERPLRSEHESLLSSWTKARLSLQRCTVVLESLQFATGYGLVVLLVFSYLRSGGDPALVLLLAYWALNLPVLGLQIGRLQWRYPEARNVFLRITEPLSAPEEVVAAPRERASSPVGSSSTGMPLRFENVTVRSSGHVLLDAIDVRIDGGSHVAIVGRSGAGKSSLLGVLLGFHFPDEGRVIVDGALLSGRRLAAVRSSTAWVDPAVQIWNRSLDENILYGNGNGDPAAVRRAIEQAELGAVVESLPGKSATPLGEGGALVSGGEGQRVRLARAFVKKDVRLALLDEPFRGLDRSHRSELLRRARELWRHATLLAITHDLAETRSFDRVLVLEGGRLVEDGSPDELLAREDSRYRRLFESERELEKLWSDPSWRRLTIESGRLREQRRG